MVSGTDYIKPLSCLPASTILLKKNFKPYMEYSLFNGKIGHDCDIKHLIYDRDELNDISLFSQMDFIPGGGTSAIFAHGKSYDGLKRDDYYWKEKSFLYDRKELSFRARSIKEFDIQTQVQGDIPIKSTRDNLHVRTSCYPNIFLDNQHGQFFIDTRTSTCNLLHSDPDYLCMRTTLANCSLVSTYSTGGRSLLDWRRDYLGCIENGKLRRCSPEKFCITFDNQILSAYSPVDRHVLSVNSGFYRQMCIFDVKRVQVCYQETIRSQYDSNPKADFVDMFGQKSIIQKRNYEVSIFL